MGDSVLFARYTRGDSVLVNKKVWGGFCPGGILSGYRVYSDFNLQTVSLQFFSFS